MFYGHRSDNPDRVWIGIIRDCKYDGWTSLGRSHAARENQASRYNRLLELKTSRLNH